MTMTTHAACTAIAEVRGDAVAVTTMGAMAMWDQVSPSDLNVSSVPMMGGASCMGLGLALARPERRVLVLDGDGSLLMQLGSLVTIANQAPANLVHFVFDNGVWYSVGGDVPHPGAGRVDYVQMALAAGYRSATEVGTTEELRAALPDLLSAPGPVLVHLRIAGLTSEPVPRFGAGNMQPFLPDAQFTRMGSQGRTLRRRLLADDA